MTVLNYLNQDSEQTLREAVWELRRAEGAEGDAAETIAPELLADIELHDAIHVVFACPTNLQGEILAHIWSVFGTSLKMEDMHRVNMHADHRSVLREIGHARLLRTWFRNVPRMLAVLWRVSRMTRRWPADDFEAFLDTPLNQLRAEFNIRVFKSNKGNKTSGGAALRSIRYRQIRLQTPS